MTEGQELAKGLGRYGAMSVVVGTMIGTAIFVVPSLMLKQVGTPLRVLAIWAAAGGLSLFGALGYAELGAAIPKAGGEYVYLHRAYGPGMGFLYGWTQFFAARTASIAAISTGFLLYLAYFFPRLSSEFWTASFSLGRHPLTLRLTGIQAGAAALIVLLSAINLLGVRRSGAIQTVFTAAKLAVLAAVIVFGLAYGHGSWSHFRAALGSQAGNSGVLAGVGLAMISALWAYDGWYNLSMVAGEVAEPERNIPVALIGGSLLVVAVYLAVNVAYFHVLAPSDIEATRTVAAQTADRVLGRAGGTLVAAGVLISTFATLNGSILAGSRIPYAQARDGLFPKALAAVEPRFQTPAMAIAAQAVIAGILALSGRYQTLYTKAIYAEWVFYGLVTSSLFVLRRREPKLARPYRTWGYPFVPGIFVTLAALLLAGAFISDRADALWCLAFIASGIPAYHLWRKFAHAAKE